MLYLHTATQIPSSCGSAQYECSSVGPGALGLHWAAAHATTTVANNNHTQAAWNCNSKPSPDHRFMFQRDPIPM
eukprot:m.250233 g.250233  ORF g.250233 m.250233 type:complete len:74 (+) comp33882_c0_seq9:4791-5012(+)